MIRDELTEEDCGLNSSWSISCSFPISFFSSLISNWRNSILWNMPRRSFSILIAVWNFTFLVPLGNCSLRHAVFSANSHVPIASLIYVVLKSMQSIITLLIFQAKLSYYKSANKSALYTPSSSIFLKLSFTAATSSW